MKELKILAVVSALVLITYYGIEPYAHHVMHPEPAPMDFTFKDAGDVDTSLKGDATNGKALVEMHCIACHSIDVAGYPQMMGDADAAAAYGVTPPDLSSSGHIYEASFLANFINNPVKAMHLEHKFPEGGDKFFPMPAYKDMASNQDIMDMVAYLKSLKSKPAEVNEEMSAFEVAKAEEKVTYEAACGRCHDMGYDNFKANTPANFAKAYLGATPPDLSQYIKSRGHHYLESFINDPQILLHGTGMPRVGLTEHAQEQVINYMEKVGDRHKDERNSLGWKVMVYMLIMSILALLWKRQIWKDLH